MAGQPVKLWDLPVRLVHWSIVLLMPALWWTWKSSQLVLHEQLGLLALGLLVFRIYWGLFGASTARFAGFVKGPRAVGVYLGTLFSKSGEPIVGHNPMGGWSVMVLLGLLSATVGAGLFTEDTDGLSPGPLNYRIHGALSEGMEHWHHLLFNGLLAFIALHLLAIGFYAIVKRENLIGPMLTGRRTLSSSIAEPAFAPLWRLALGVAFAILVVWWIWLGAPLHGPAHL